MNTPPTTTRQDWLLAELRVGLQKLLCLRLEGTPSADMIRGTLAAWYDAITRRKAYEQDRDAPRIRDAFVTLAATRRRWPAPVDLLESMPSIATTPPRKRLSNDAMDERTRAAIDALAEKLGLSR